MNNQNQPREFDAIMGGESPPPVHGVVLGGLEGVKNRLKSSDIDLQITALSEALSYGDVGIDLVIEALHSKSKRIQRSAARLLRRGEAKGKQALLNYDPRLFFTTLENWKIEDFNPEIGISDLTNTAYRLTIDWDSGKNFQATTPKTFELLLADLQAGQVEALLLPFGNDCSCKRVVNALFQGKDRLTNLKALYIGDMHDYEYKNSHVYLSNMSLVLEAYPRLEVLQVCGFGYDEGGLKFDPIRHENLKTLIIETGHLLCPEIIQQICTLELPSLEYLELWLVNDSYYPIWHAKKLDCYINESDIKHLVTIVSGQSFPHLKYLGLRNTDYSDMIAKSIVKPPLMNNLKVLDISIGTLTPVGANFLLNCPATNNLHTLDVSNNLLGTSAIQQLSHLNCQVIAEPQIEDAESRRYFAITEQYSEVYAKLRHDSQS